MREPERSGSPVPDPVAAIVTARFTSILLPGSAARMPGVPSADGCATKMSRFQWLTSKIGRQIAVALSVTAVVVVLGCGDESGLGRRYKITGRVTYKGANVQHGTVNFIPTKPEGRAATGTIQDGRYSLSTAGDYDGALPGDYNVAIVAMDIDLSSAMHKEGGLTKIHEGDELHQKAIKNAKKLIPDKYGVPETSGLKATVDGNKEINFDLTD